MTSRMPIWIKMRKLADLTLSVTAGRYRTCRPHRPAGPAQRSSSPLACAGVNAA